MTFNLILGLILSSLMGFGGYARQALSRSGVLGAILVGTAIFGCGGPVWGLVLVGFFVSASALSALSKQDKAGMAEKFDKGSRRDLGQAMANGGLGALLALGNTIWPGIGWGAAFLGAMATVNADTWATELGVLSPEQPRLITTGRPVPVGTSGGITALGTLATIGGGLFIGLVAWVFASFQMGLTGWPDPWTGVGAILLAGGSGLAGSLVDSLLGATLQVIYICPVCGVETEQSHHQPCGSPPTRRLRGLPWLNNDLVNFISSLAGAVAAVGLGRLLL